MNPTIQTQLNELKATLELILAGIKMLQEQLEDEDNKADFNAWCDAFDQRWADHADPSANNHPASFGYNVHPSEWGKS